jgi:hypothetical protein
VYGYNEPGSHHPALVAFGAARACLPVGRAGKLDLMMQENVNVIPGFPDSPKVGTGRSGNDINV